MFVLKNIYFSVISMSTSSLHLRSSMKLDLESYCTILLVLFVPIAYFTLSSVLNMMALRGKLSMLALL